MAFVYHVLIIFNMFLSWYNMNSYHIQDALENMAPLNCLKLELNTVCVIYSGSTDGTGVTSSVDNEEHSQIIIHCTPSTGKAKIVGCSFLL